MNIHDLSQPLNNIHYTLTCPNCSVLFEVNASLIKKALADKQKNVFCSSQCSHDFRKLSKDDLALRLLDFYFTHAKVPKFSDFKLSSVYRKKFGNWTKALEYAGLNFEKTNSDKTHHNTWQRQYERHRKIKSQLISLKGGQCENCGYRKNMAALTFHHIDPSKKELSMDARSMGNISMEKLLIEAEKCQLLCANCHLEHHSPHLAM